MDSEICHVMLAGHIYKLFVLSCFGHCCKTIFSHLSLMEAQTQFSAQTGMQACSWPFHTSIQTDGIFFTLRSESLQSLYQLLSLHNTCHACMISVFSLGLLERERLFCFYGVLLLTCMLSQEKRPDVVHRWEFGTDYYILFDCKDLQHSNVLSAQPFTAVAQRYNSVDWLKCLFKVPPRFTPQ